MSQTTCVNVFDVSLFKLNCPHLEVSSLAALAFRQINERTFRKSKRECQMRQNGTAALKGFGLWRVVYDKANEKRILFLKGKKHVDKTAALEGL